MIRNPHKTVLSTAVMTAALTAALTAVLTAVLLDCRPALAGDTALSKSTSGDFAFKLFAQASKKDRKNTLISPFSAYQALSMTANGAEGSTKNQMAKVLGVVPDQFDLLNKRNQEVLTDLNNNTKVQMEIANAIFVDAATPFKASFIDLCAKTYRAEARTENFADPATIGKINAWCDTKTHGKIKEILARLTPAEKMVLLNSLYFKGDWKSPFKADATKQQAFTPLSGGAKQVAMMHKNLSLDYMQGKGFAAIGIPYAGDRQMMYIFLPDQGTDFAAFQSQCTLENWQKWMTGFSDRRVNLAMPKYKIEFSSDLSEALKAMGMAEAFGGKANFAKMSDQRTLALGRVLQKTYLDVNEKGTEAAAVTAVTVFAASAHMEPRPVDFIVDHPFVVALVDKNTSEILFLGSILDPKIDL